MQAFANNSSCNGLSQSSLIIASSINGVSMVVCVLAIILLCVLKLYRKPVYRLALYQVLVASSYASVFVASIIFIDYYAHPDIYEPLCVTFAFWNMYFIWTKLLLTVCVSFHLFVFAVLNKNLSRLEPLYVVFSLFVSAVISVVPFMTRSYGLSGSYCWIQEWKNNCNSEVLRAGVIEQFALWYVPSMVILTIASTAMVIMVIVLVYRANVRRGMNNQHWQALKQLLPLSAYPILFFVFDVPTCVNRAYGTRSDVPTNIRDLLSVLDAISVMGFSLSPGVILVVHVVVAKLCSKRIVRKPSRKHVQFGTSTISDEGQQTAHPEYNTFVNSNTSFKPSKQSNTSNE